MPTLPLANPHPDIAAFMDAVLGRRKPARPPLVEYIVDDTLRQAISTHLLGRAWVEWGDDHASQARWLDNYIEFWRRMGYDFVRYERGLPFARRQMFYNETASTGVARVRAWTDEHQGPIATWEDFERYPWPKLEEFDFFPFEYLNAHLPEGMGLLCCHGGGLFEHLSQLMSLEGLSYALYDDPALVRAIVERLEGLIGPFHRMLCQLDGLAAVFQGDDLGFRSGTLISPADVRKYVLPWHQRMAAQAHATGKAYFLHSCGNLEAIMPDLVNEVGIDAKHSYEDAILPAPEFQARWGDHIAVLGGLDLNILAGGTEAEVRTRTRELMDVCGARGRYAVGSGNSVPSYVPLGNYLAMVEEAVAPTL